MPRYEGSPANVTASIEVFPKDDYEFVVGEPKPFSGITKNGKNAGKENFGVRFPLVVGSGDYKDKRTVATFYLHNEESEGMTKQFQMAALGYGKGRAEEERFNAEWGAKDWSIDFDARAVGDAWREITGQRVVGVLDQGISETDGSEQQKWNGWRALNS